MFNLLTGYSQRRRWRKLVVAPVELRERVIALIERERGHAESGKPARIIVKMNALVEVSVIDALYRASQAGVDIDLIIRGTCSLRAGLPGVSDRIRVTSIVDRFLEHSRVFYFANDGNPEVFLASADWMPRNFFRRIEVMFPVEDAQLKARICERILPTILANVQARVQNPDGSYLAARRRRTASPRCAPRPPCTAWRAAPRLTSSNRAAGDSSSRCCGAMARKESVEQRATATFHADGRKEGPPPESPRRRVELRRYPSPVPARGLLEGAGGRGAFAVGRIAAPRASISTL